MGNIALTHWKQNVFPKKMEVVMNYQELRKIQRFTEIDGLKLAYIAEGKEVPFLPLEEPEIVVKIMESEFS
jgi:hypothetical protein